MAEPTNVFALFKRREDAEGALGALTNAGFDPEAMGILGPGQEEDQKYGSKLAAGVGGATAAGAVAGGVIGAMAAGLIPGLGIVIATGSLIPVLVGVMTGGSAGLVAGGLLAMAGSSERALYYEQQVKAGNYLLVVQSDRPQDAAGILEQSGAFEAAPV